MTTICSIVVGTDFSAGSDAAVERALQLALAHGASLRLLHAFDVSFRRSLRGVFDSPRFTTEVPPDVQTQQRLNDMAQALAARTGLGVQARFSIDTAENAISAYVAAHETSLVVLGSRADLAVPGLGGTASKALRSPVCPILVVREPEGRPYDQILSALELDDASMRVLECAFSLFPTARHHMLHALDPARERALWLDGLTQEPVELLHQSMQTQAVQELERLTRAVSRGAAHRVVHEVVGDVPARAVVERAVALPANCVVVGYGGADRVIERQLGSIPQHVLQHGGRDVLVVP